MSLFDDECQAAARAIRERRNNRPRRTPADYVRILPRTLTASGPCPACGSMSVAITGGAALVCETCNLEITRYD